ncbi:MAG: hypothetical protein A3B31_00495 [Candidatus Komeilibacteria bacterium RIFCSPLOWO2_01_FULL_53_11]|uniref:Uncharacterized protein n=1 Tax=Candidatus Komeilibacteria bacterium RIFCSPLOWO2_01_FULL_53_11 TaxID=1798552 RepID=A0A1G2BXI8_9BACT|nr:MAG: hypothetical protein A3B31_00495 [Candidatus Komeilibacteria bacterium RIFCSPLOWO2_01_FULL_53_11]
MRSVSHSGSKFSETYTQYSGFGTAGQFARGTPICYPAFSFFASNCRQTVYADAKIVYTSAILKQYKLIIEWNF